jgi:hypothetical protein
MLNSGRLRRQLAGAGLYLVVGTAALMILGIKLNAAATGSPFFVSWKPIWLRARHQADVA